MFSVSLFHTPRYPFALASHRRVQKAFCAIRVTPGLAPTLCTIYPGRMVRLQDIDDETVVFTFSDHWYMHHLDDFVEATRGKDLIISETRESPRSSTLDHQNSKARQRAVSASGLHVKSVEPEQPGIKTVGLEEGGQASSLESVSCEECDALLNAFAEAVQEVVTLNQRHLLAVAANEPDPHRFDLLIHAANERKQDAKYAYVNHQESHGCSSKQ